MSLNRYQQCMTNVLVNILSSGTFDGYFKFIKKLMNIFLSNNNASNFNFKHFISNKLIDKRIFIKILIN